MKKKKSLTEKLSPRQSLTIGNIIQLNYFLFLPEEKRALLEGLKNNCT
jgi:hypothetical protein